MNTFDELGEMTAKAEVYALGDGLTERERDEWQAKARSYRRQQMALLDGVQEQRPGQVLYMPEGRNRRLAVASVWVCIWASFALYAVMLWATQGHVVGRVQ